jgi:SWI/SNF-related matrix-associated actin-dependent regulator 1 of chromatin subfamily A
VKGEHTATKTQKRGGSANLTILAMVLAIAAVALAAWTVVQVRQMAAQPESEITTGTNFDEIRKIQKRVQYLEDMAGEGKKALFDSMIAQVRDAANYLAAQDLSEEQKIQLRDALLPVCAPEEEAVAQEAPASEQAEAAPAIDDAAEEAPAAEAVAEPAEEQEPAAEAVAEPTAETEAVQAEEAPAEQAANAQEAPAQEVMDSTENATEPAQQAPEQAE